MKKVIYILGIIFLIVVIAVNMVFTAKLGKSEHIIITINHFIYIISIIILAILIYYTSKKTNEKLEKSNLKKPTKKYIFLSILVIYILLNIIWITAIKPGVGGDSIHVCNIAQTMYRGNNEEFLPKLTYAGITLKEYMQEYPQQILLAFIYSIIFKIIHCDKFVILRFINIIGNILIVIAIYKISKQISKEYKSNKILPLVLILTFVSLPMLTTFIYGDIPSLGLSLLAVYSMMKYTESKKIKYPIIASILTMIAYMMRMNTLIFIIATVMYLIFNLVKEFSRNNQKQNIINAAIVIAYISISIVPSIAVKNYYFKKYNLDQDKTYPKISYIYMSMKESPRGKGWYNEKIAEPALHQEKDVEKKYNKRIKERVDYFSNHPRYTINFYTQKIASMWSENTYSAIMNNAPNKNKILKKVENPLILYQKAAIVIITSCSLIIIMQNRKKLSIDIIFLLTIFIGGFAFHILWEAKSRYIIPYIVVLIPITSISINKLDIKGVLKKKNSKA